MKEEITRINRLVAEGRITPEEGADLIEALYKRQTPPEPPPFNRPGFAGRPGSPFGADPLQSLKDSIEKLTKEGRDAVDWEAVARQTREGARRGFDAIMTGLDDLSKGKTSFGFGLFGNQSTREVVLPLNATAGSTIRIDNPCGGVSVRGGEGPFQVIAQATFRAATAEEARSRADHYSLMVEESDSVFTIRQPDVSGLKVDLAVVVPLGVTVDVRLDDGDLNVKDTSGPVRLHSRSGDVNLRGAKGTVDISIDSGDVNVKDIDQAVLTVEGKSDDINMSDVRGTINARMASGDINLSGECQNIALEAVSGNVNVDLRAPITGNINIRSVSGDCNVRIPGGSDARVALSTLRGNIHSDIEFEEADKSDQRLTGRLGSGAGSIDVSAVTGDIKFGQRDAAS